MPRHRRSRPARLELRLLLTRGQHARERRRALERNPLELELLKPADGLDGGWQRRRQREAIMRKNTCKDGDEKRE